MHAEDNLKCSPRPREFPVTDQISPSAKGQPQADVQVSATIPLAGRLSHHIPKPKDWQAFQRNCVFLYRAELNDPHAVEYGRQGQTQRGIDIIGKRNGNPDRYVGIQCRHVVEPLKQTKIMADCRAALDVNANLREIIFATTAPNDTAATDAAVEVERQLRTEGYDLVVALYGWGALQERIAVHPEAYAAFCPSIVATSARQSEVFQQEDEDRLADKIAARVVRGLGDRPNVITRDVAGKNSEDLALHGRIDALRDLLRNDRQTRIAHRALLDILEKEDLSAKPWARFRLETNLASAAIDLGNEEEAAKRYELAHGLFPDEPLSVANMALARVIQGKPEEAMEFAQRALSMTPRADHAVGYLLQAAARASWDGDPETLIPSDLVGTSHADIGLAEFVRRREKPGWPDQVVTLCRRHPGTEEFKRLRATAVLALAVESENLLAGGVGPVTAEELKSAADDMKAFAERCLDIDFADRRDLAAYLNNAGSLLRLCNRHAECAALLERGLARVPDEVSIRKLLALAQVLSGRRADALKTIGASSDPEGEMLAAELLAAENTKAGIERVLALDDRLLDRRLRRLKWGLVGELSLRA